MDNYFVYVTTKNEADAKLIARTVLEERLAACANILGSVQSVYWWEGKVCEDKEVALVLKTTDSAKAKLVERVKQIHSYEIPCIICLPIADGNPEFIDWIRREVQVC
ncbi:MAG TPA: divalent-cation tolerance protein CutA [Pontiella sp.]